MGQPSVHPDLNPQPSGCKVTELTAAFIMSSSLPSIKTTITSWVIHATDMQKCIILITIVMNMNLLLVCERPEGEEHASVLPWLTVSACLRFPAFRSRFPAVVPEPFVQQRSHLHPDEDGAALFNKGSWRATWMLLPQAINHEITFSQLERLRASTIIATAFNNCCLITPQQRHFCKNTQKYQEVSCFLWRFRQKNTLISGFL